MNYIDMVRNAPNKSESVMWESVSAISELLDSLKEHHPEMASKFIMKEYGRMYGNHFNEEMARDIVSAMFHYTKHNDTVKLVKGEAVSVEDAQKIVEGKADAETLKWDAYVGANGFLHDLANTDLTNQQILQAAKVFWFHDDDFGGDEKVYWYYSSK